MTQHEILAEDIGVEFYYDHEGNLTQGGPGPKPDHIIEYYAGQYSVDGRQTDLNDFIASMKEKEIWVAYNEEGVPNAIYKNNPQR